MNELLGRAYLEEAIGKAQTRNARRAAQDIKLRAERARDNAAMFIAENPLASVGGSLVIGILIGAMLPRAKFGKSVKALAGAVSEAGIAYGKQALDAALKTRRNKAEESADDE